MELESLSFAALVSIGFVNVVTMFRPIDDSRIKLAIAFVVAFGVSFIPQDISNMLLAKSVDALKIAFIGTGGYKLAQIIGKK